jgi:hypothetical protein
VPLTAPAAPGISAAASTAGSRTGGAGGRAVSEAKWMCDMEQTGRGFRGELELEVQVQDYGRLLLPLQAKVYAIGDHSANHGGLCVPANPAKRTPAEACLEACGARPVAAVGALQSRRSGVGGVGGGGTLTGRPSSPPCSRNAGISLHSVEYMLHKHSITGEIKVLMSQVRGQRSGRSARCGRSVLQCPQWMGTAQPLAELPVEPHLLTRHTRPAGDPSVPEVTPPQVRCQWRVSWENAMALQQWPRLPFRGSTLGCKRGCLS